MAPSSLWTRRASLALLGALVGCSAPREPVSIDFDRLGEESPVPVASVGSLGTLPASPPGERLDAKPLATEARARLQRWRAEIDDFIADLRVQDLRRREEVIRVAFEERYAGDRERALREHRAYAEGLERETQAAIHQRLSAYADDVAPWLARLAALGLYPNPGDAAMADGTNLDGRERARRSEGRTLWAQCASARERYEADVAQLLADASDRIDLHLTELLAELERTRQARETETPISRPAPVAGLVQEEGRLRDGAVPASLPPRVRSYPARTLRRPNLGGFDRPAARASRESLLVEARVFAAQRGYTLANPRDPGRDVTAEFAAWRNGYRSTR